MIVNKVAMYGFKHHSDLVDYELGKRTNIYGDNEQGKTTIGEIIAWTLLGCDLTGNERATTRLTNHNCKDVYGEINFSFKDKNHNLVRRKKGSTKIYLDGSEVKQDELSSFYYSKELFLSIFNPRYFPTLAPREAKDLLTKVLGDIDKEIVMKELPELVAKKLNQTGFNAPNLYLENQRERLREIVKEIEYWNGFRDGQQDNQEIPEELTFDESELMKYQKELDVINKTRPQGMHDISKLHIKREELMNQIDDLKAQIRRIELSRPKLADIGELSIEVNTLRNDFQSVQKLVRSLNKTIKCPTCKSTINVNESAKNKALIKLEELKVKGVKEADNLKEIETSNAKITAMHEEFKQETIKGLEDTISDLEAKIGALNIRSFEQENIESIKTQERKIENKRIEIVRLMSPLLDAKQEVALNNAKREEIIKQQEEIAKKIEESRKTIEELSEEKTDVERCIDYAKQFNSKKLDLQSEQIDKHLTNVKIQLTNLNKPTGEVVDSFKILYKDKEFPILSNSETFKAGLEIANLLINVSGLSVPVFLDDAESITRIPELDTQMIMARVKENAELTVEVA